MRCGRWGSPACGMTAVLRRRKLKQVLASTGRFIASFFYSALTVEIGRGYAEYLPTGFFLDSDNDKDKNDG